MKTRLLLAALKKTREMSRKSQHDDKNLGGDFWIVAAVSVMDG
jgi:hypothetical protein